MKQNNETAMKMEIAQTRKPENMLATSNLVCHASEAMMDDDAMYRQMIGHSTNMKTVYQTHEGACIQAALSRDISSKAVKLRIQVAYPDGEFSNVLEYPKRKILGNKNVLLDLSDLDGITPEDTANILEEIKKHWKELPVEDDRENKCSLIHAYQALCEYVQTCSLPGKVFGLGKDGTRQYAPFEYGAIEYGVIESSYLSTVLKYLDLGYEPSELKKELAARNLVKANRGNTSHPHEYMMRVNGQPRWHICFRLPDTNISANN